MNPNEWIFKLLELGVMVILSVTGFFVSLRLLIAKMDFRLERLDKDFDQYVKEAQRRCEAAERAMRENFEKDIHRHSREMQRLEDYIEKVDDKIDRLGVRVLSNSGASRQTD